MFFAKQYFLHPKGNFWHKYPPYRVSHLDYSLPYLFVNGKKIFVHGIMLDRRGRETWYWTLWCLGGSLVIKSNYITMVMRYVKKDIPGALRQRSLPVHVIFDGKGYFRKDGVVKTLTKNQAFLIRPGEITFYQADLDAPWTYAWIGFVGGQSCQFLHEGKLAESSVFEIEEGNLARKYLKQLLRTDANAPESIFRLRGLMYLFLSEIYKQLSDEEEDLAINVQQEIYIEKAIDFVERNYSRNIGVADVVSYVGLNRSYFSQLFRTCLKISPQEYLIQFRMKGKELLVQLH